MQEHFFFETSQPLMEYLVEVYVGEKPVHLRFTNNPKARRRCHECNRVREVKNLVIHCYYDGSRVSCREGHDYIRRGWYESVRTRKEPARRRRA